MIKTDIISDVQYNTDSIKNQICSLLPIQKEEITDLSIVKKVLKFEDGRPMYALSVALSLSPEREAGLLKMKKKVSIAPDYSFEVPSFFGGSRPVIIGAGPAGLFSALVLAEAGAMPILLERGDAVEERIIAKNRFFSDGNLDPESNIQFGEGGAGAFSDGKLKVGGMDKYKYKVLSEFISAGAPEDIAYTVGAHLGTDKLPIYIKAIREKIKSLGGSIFFRAKATDIKVKDSKVYAVEYLLEGKSFLIETDRVIFAAGHSAKDSFEILLSKNAPIEPRGFGIGVRIEHPREYIDGLVYKDSSLAKELGTASYHLVTHLKSGRSVYSFCMCPGGTVVAAASEEGGVVTNGMSEYMRDADNSNAAHLVSVTPKDFASEHPLAGIDLQRKIENSVYRIGGQNYNAPAERMEDFMKRSKPTSFGSVKPSYPCGVSLVSTEEYLPSFITESLREGILDFDDWMKGFYYPDSVITGAETRSTSPVKVLRGDNYMCIGIEGLYPIGEGAGYAGGIVSAAADGVRAAEKILFENC